jgi:hypothetical protein
VSGVNVSRLVFDFVFELVLAVDYPLAVILSAEKDLSSIAPASRFAGGEQGIARIAEAQAA